MKVSKVILKKFPHSILQISKTNIRRNITMNAIAKFTSTNPNGLALLKQNQAWLEACLENENVCHYFAIQIKGKESYPFGAEDRPFFDLEKAQIYLEHLQATNPNINYFISSGAFDTDAFDFDDENLPMWHRVWLNKHQYRIIKLQILKMTDSELSQLISNYNEIKIWQEEHNTKEICHCYTAQSFDDSNGDISISSQFTTNLMTALSAKIYFEKTMSNRNFRVICGLMTTEQVMGMDGKVNEELQDFIDQHKARLQSLSKESAA
ncbi:hypothetical protein ACIAD2196 [Acinetobacter baylyi ADP1]|uniref:Uncharacterized protein n=2 Tax=Moraxellaceae TaxID=468 RepID=Q6FAB8_ACIAD|nr:hypothetical protein ACIAD2196 [Acinetobacter baylyi ADP1]